MNIALVTNKKLHHKYWICELYSKNNVKLILHPIHSSEEDITNKIRKKKLFNYGFIWFILKTISLVYNKFAKNSMQNSIKKNEIKYFKIYERKYGKIPKNIIFDIDTVNSSKTIALIKRYNIDVICFLGGDIAKKDFINSSKLCLNFHSGISPFYNGNKTIFHAVSDFRPNFSGGTLMKMNERIDSGNILMHYLCPINRNDSASDLFMKGIKGSVKLYDEVLKKFEKQSLKGIKQKRSFKNVKNRDWTITNDIRLKYFENSKRMKFYERAEHIIDYTELYSDDIGKLYKKSLEIILYN